MSTPTTSATPSPVTSYPVRVSGRLDEPLSQALWLVKWLLAVPHAVVLFFLWVGFAFSWLAALVAIAVTGRYPRRLFDYNLGVLRWTWRVGFYAYSGLGTDRYPPFSLQEEPDYPARLDVAYPESLSRGKVWVKWWLLAIPHWLVVGALAGSGWGMGNVASIGLIGALVVIAGGFLLVRDEYPRHLFDLVMGLNRWVLRVAAYVSLMTDAYPPFRLDQGATDD
jgi:hypothetical protein